MATGNAERRYVSGEGWKTVAYIPEVTEAGAAARAQGLVAQSHSRSDATQNISLGSGELNASLVGVVTEMILSSVHFKVNVADAGATLCKVGLYSAAGALLVGSANTVAALTSTGLKTVALTTPYVVPSSIAVYAAIVAAFPVGVGLLRTAVDGDDNAGFGSGSPLSTFSTGLADLPANLILTNLSDSVIWFGVS